MSEIELVEGAEVVERSAAMPAGLSWGQAWELAQRIARTEFVPSALRGKPESVLAAILFGRELGIGPMQALQAIHVIDGRPGASPELMRALVARAGHRIDLESSSDEAVTLRGERADTGSSATVTWSLADAERAGLIQIREGRPWARSSSGKRLPWEQYTRAMLTARATSELCRILFPDVISGLSYTVEELESLGPIAAAPLIDWGALGWSGQAEHDEQRGRVRRALAELPADVRGELRHRWDEHGLAWPLSRDQLADWDATVAAIVEQHAATEPAIEAGVIDTPPGRADGDTRPDETDETEHDAPADASPRTAPGPRTVAPPAHVDEVRTAGIAAGLTSDEVLEVIGARFGRPIASLDELTAAQARATVEILRSAASPIEGAP